MLRLSKKADYALMAMKHLATHIRRRVDQRARDRRGIQHSARADGQGAAEAGARGLLASHQGTRGGYTLSKAPSSISVADIIQAIDGPLTVTACSTEDEQCEQFNRCNVRDPLWRIKDRIIAALATVSLAEIASEVPLQADVSHVTFRTPRSL
jgi:Rrf2 family protein